MDYEKPEVIEEEMLRTRVALTEKVTALEEEVLGTIENTSTAVTSTVERVQGFFDNVEGFLADTATGIRDGFTHAVQSADLNGAVARNPWASVGGAALAGVVTGWLVFGRQPVMVSGTGKHEAFTPAPPNPRPAASSLKVPGWLQPIVDRVSDEARRVGETAVAAASTSLRRLIETQVPQQLNRLVDGGPTAAESGHRVPNGYRRPATV